MSDRATHYPLAQMTASATAMGWSVWSALDANAVQAWGAAIVALVAGLAAIWQNWRRQTFERARSERLLRAVDAANERALRQGRPVPHPEFLPPPTRPPDPPPAR